MPVAVVGFGDRGFPQFCRFADDVGKALTSKCWPVIVPVVLINRQSGQEFARWVQSFGTALDTPLDMVARPRTLQVIFVRESGEVISTM